MTDLRRLCALLISLGMLALPLAQAADLSIDWPADWQVQPLPPTPEGDTEDTGTLRQRAVKNDPAGEPQIVMELTRSPLQPGHVVNLPSVLLQMRKTVQIDFVRNGFMSVCNAIHPSTLGNLNAVESTCTVTRNGAPVMTQTLVAAASTQTAWSLSYAGPIEGYKANAAQVQAIRSTLHLSD